MNARIKALLEEVRDHEHSGLFGTCAKICLSDYDEDKAIQFIRELGEYTHIYNMRKTLGDELVQKIMAFCDEQGFVNPFRNSNLIERIKVETRSTGNNYFNKP